MKNQSPLFIYPGNNTIKETAPFIRAVAFTFAPLRFLELNLRKKYIILNNNKKYECYEETWI